MQSKPFQTVGEFLASLNEQDMTLADWARSHGFVIDKVYQLARGRTMGRRGDARHILRAMNVVVPPMHPHAKAPRTSSAGAKA